MMRRRWISGAIVVLACLVLVSPEASAQRRGGRFQERAAVANGWKFDYKSARKTAQSEQKPMMVVFRCVP